MRTMSVAMVGLLGALGAQQPVAEFEWMTSIPAAERMAARTGKPMLLVFR